MFSHLGILINLPGQWNRAHMQHHKPLRQSKTELLYQILQSNKLPKETAERNNTIVGICTDNPSLSSSHGTRAFLGLQICLFLVTGSYRLVLNAFIVCWLLFRVKGHCTRLSEFSPTLPQLPKRKKMSRH